MANLYTVEPTPTREQIEEFYKEHKMATEPGDLPWVAEHNMVLKYLRDLALQGYAFPEEKDTAWLIESVGGRWGTGYFWKGVTQYGTWGTVDEAVRFARKADAERVIESLHEDDIKRYGYKQELKYEACEHQWPPSPRGTLVLCDCHDGTTHAMDKLCVECPRHVRAFL